MHWIYLLALVLILTGLVSEPARAQDAPPALIVRLRDVAGAGVAGVTVIVTDQSGATVLGRATTDATGGAAFGPLRVGDVRVRVEGRLADGTLLVQPGADAHGIAVILGGPSVTLELRSETDGTVLPDPEAELTLEPGVAAPRITVDPAQVPSASPASAPMEPTVAAFPTAPLANTVAAVPPARPASSPDSTPHAEPQASSATAPAEAPAAPRWLGLVLLAVLGLALAIMVFEYLRTGKL